MLCSNKLLRAGIMFVQVELETILDYLWDLLGAWDWKRNSIPRYESEYQELYDFIQELTKKRNENAG